jgi:hypothetical protein
MLESRHVLHLLPGLCTRHENLVTAVARSARFT